jgi:hypothetical protein
VEKRKKRGRKKAKRAQVLQHIKVASIRRASEGIWNTLRNYSGSLDSEIWTKFIVREITSLCLNLEDEIGILKGTIDKRNSKIKDLNKVIRKLSKSISDSNKNPFDSAKGDKVGSRSPRSERVN